VLQQPLRLIQIVLCLLPNTFVAATSPHPDPTGSQQFCCSNQHSSCNWLIWCCHMSQQTPINFLRNSAVHLFPGLKAWRPCSGDNLPGCERRSAWGLSPGFRMRPSKEAFMSNAAVDHQNSCFDYSRLALLGFACSGLLLLRTPSLTRPADRCRMLRSLVSAAPDSLSSMRFRLLLRSARRRLRFSAPVARLLFFGDRSMTSASLNRGLLLLLLLRG
jgi:hypothetical protein